MFPLPQLQNQPPLHLPDNILTPQHSHKNLMHSPRLHIHPAAWPKSLHKRRFVLWVRDRQASLADQMGR